jgi:hypothetical protein
MASALRIGGGKVEGLKVGNPQGVLFCFFPPSAYRSCSVTVTQFSV